MSQVGFVLLIKTEKYLLVLTTRTEHRNIYLVEHFDRINAFEMVEISLCQHKTVNHV